MIGSGAGVVAGLASGAAVGAGVQLSVDAGKATLDNTQLTPTQTLKSAAKGVTLGLVPGPKTSGQLGSELLEIGVDAATSAVSQNAASGTVDTLGALNDQPVHPSVPPPASVREKLDKK